MNLKPLTPTATAKIKHNPTLRWIIIKPYTKAFLPQLPLANTSCPVFNKIFHSMLKGKKKNQTQPEDKKEMLEPDSDMTDFEMI